MGFHNLLFPKSLSLGTRGGAGFRTSVLESDSGPVIATTRYRDERGRVSFEVSKAVQTRADIAELLSFWWAVKGGSRGFRFRDPTDWTTGANNIAIPTFAPADRSVMNPSFADGATRVFRLQKAYVDAQSAQTIATLRRITRPIPPGDPDTLVAIFMNGTLVWISGQDLTGGIFRITAEYDTGRIHITPPPPAGTFMEAAFTFDMPAQFDRETDEALAASWDESDQFDVEPIRIVEIHEDRHTDTEELIGGGHGAVVVTANPHPINLEDGELQTITGHTSGWVVSLPDLATLWTTPPSGGPWLTIENGSPTSSFDLRNSNGTLLAPVLGNQVAHVYWINSSLLWRLR